MRKEETRKKEEMYQRMPRRRIPRGPLLFCRCAAKKKRNLLSRNGKSPRKYGEGRKSRGGGGCQGNKKGKNEIKETIEIRNQVPA